MIAMNDSMFTSLKAASALALTLLLTASGLAAETSSMPLNPDAPQIVGKSWVLIDVRSDTVLAAGNPDQRIEPASLTKLMTAYLSFKAIKQHTLELNTVVNVSTKAWKTEGSRMFIEPDRPVTVDELLHGMIIQSGNDASIALAEKIAVSEDKFAELMNKEAERLGMTNTHFVNATGLPDPQHYSSANDLARIAKAIQRDFPDFYPLYSEKFYKYNKISQPNRNRLLFKDASVDGMKTGHTDSAGFCLVASAKRGERRLLTVVTGTESENARASETEKLLNYGFQNFDAFKIHPGGQVYQKIPVFKGHSDLLDAGFRSDLWITLPKSALGKFQETFHPKSPLIAPIKAGTSVGTLDIMVEGKVMASYDVPALSDVPEGNLLQKLWGSLRLMMH